MVWLLHIFRLKEVTDGNSIKEDIHKHKGATTMGDEAEYLEQQNIDDYFDDPEEGDDD